MADQVTLTIDGKTVQAAPGTLLIEVTKRMGIDVPAFCYYEGLKSVAACRMCLVEIEGQKKLQTACTVPVGEGMVVRTQTAEIVNSRKYMLEFLLTNHPLDCPVCDKGGECELQDMTFRYGAGESRFTEIKHHVDEKQFSPVVYFDPPRCILCFRCVRVCDEGLGVGALGVSDRGAISEIIPNRGDHLECDECGACIDICPVGALTSGMYRYQTRPWEMNHVGTICTHCSNGCKTTLGIRNNEIIRGNNRDRSGINGEFLCIKGRYAGDFVHHPERLQSPLVKRGGLLQEVAWSEAVRVIGEKFREVRARGGSFGVIGSSRITNEEAWYLQNFARQALGTSNIDHQRTGDVVALIDALAGRENALATMDDLYRAKAVLAVGTDLAQQQPLIANQLRANVRHFGGHVYTVAIGPVREDAISRRAVVVQPGGELDGVRGLAEDLKAEPELVIVFGDAIQGQAVRELVAFGDSLGIPVKYVCLVDYVNSRGAVDMGLLPDLGPGYTPVGQPGLSLSAMLASPDLDVLWVVGADPLSQAELASAGAFVVVQDLFLTRTAQAADVVLPSAALYEKSGTVTNVCGEVQKLTRALETMGTKPDLEIFGLLSKELGVKVGRWTPQAVFDEIRGSVRGYNIPLPLITTGGAAPTAPLNGRVPVAHEERIQSARDTLFTSGTLGTYSKTLNEVTEAPGALYSPMPK